MELLIVRNDMHDGKYYGLLHTPHWAPQQTDRLRLMLSRMLAFVALQQVE